MNKEQDQPHTFCEKCQKFIRTTNYLIHQARCNGRQRMSESRMLDSRMSESRASRQGMRPSRIFSEKKPNKSPSQEIEQEKIPCPYCGYMQSLLELDTHPNQCSHRQIQCEGCHAFYPLSLIQQHNIVCPNRNRGHQEILEPGIFRRRSRHFEQEDQQQYRPGRINPRQMHPFQHMVQMMQGMNSRRNDLGILINLLARMGSHGQEDNGLDQQQIKSFPTQKYHQKSEEPDLCTVCYCNFEENQQIMNLPCKHIYHPECIGKWLQKNDKCPICKQSVRKNQPNQRNRQRRGNQGREGARFFMMM